MVRHLYGGSTSDYTAEVVNNYQRRVGGVILDVRRVDTKAGVTGFLVPPDWDGVAFPTTTLPDGSTVANRIVSDRDGDIRFLGPDGLTARLEVRTTATGNRRAGDWWILDGQPPPIVEGGDVDALRGALMQYVDTRIADATLGDVDLSGLATQAQLTAAVDAVRAQIPTLPDLTGFVDEDDARSIADAAAAAALAGYQPPTPDLSGYAQTTDLEALRSALAALLMRVENLENGTTPTDPPADAYSDTYEDAY